MRAPASPIGARRCATIGNPRSPARVSNKGKRSVDRVHVNVLVGPCCPNEEIRHDWFPRVDAGKSVRLTASVRFPDGFGMVAATARPTQSPKRVVDANEATRQPTVVMIGKPR